MDFDVSMTCYFDRQGFKILIFFAIAFTVLFYNFASSLNQSMTKKMVSLKRNIKGSHNMRNKLIRVIQLNATI